MDNLSLIGLEEIPKVLGDCTGNISSSINQMKISCQRIQILIGGSLGSQWGNIANDYSKIDERITTITNELVETINNYINSTIANEKKVAGNITNVNENLANINKALADIDF